MPSVIDRARASIAEAFPAFRNVAVAESWGGMIDVMPDAIPVISPVDSLPGFFIATALSAPVLMSPAGVGRLLQPLTVFHPEWVGGRIEHVTAALARFRERPSTLASCFGGAVFVQAATVTFYLAVAYALRIHVTAWDLAVIVPISFIVQMLPVSVNGFGVREATFSFYFTRIGLPIESALLVSLVGTALVMLFSLTGAAVYIARGRT